MRWGVSRRRPILRAITPVNKYDTNGYLYEITDAAGGKVVYSYNNFGKPDTITSNGLKTILGYDSYGRRTSLKDPNLTGSIRNEYNAYGQLTYEINARGDTTHYQYDIAGRTTKETRPNGEGVFDYEYVASGNGLGQIEHIKKNDSIVQSYTYDQYGRVLADTETFEGVNYTNSYTYDNLMRLKTRTSPSGLVLTYNYSNNSDLYKITQNGTSLWELNAINAIGQITQSTLGNGTVRGAAYNRYDLLTSLTLKKGSAVRDSIGFDFNHITGNLTSRNDSINGLNESFGYDDLNRLTSIRLGNNSSTPITYHPNGNIETKFDVGTYAYENNNHAASGITDAVMGYAPKSFEINYNSTNRVADVTLEGDTIKKVDFAYGYDNQRRKMRYYESNTLKRTRYYIGSYEKEVPVGGTIKEIDYIYLPGGEVAVAEKVGSARTFRYVHTDHLGSFRTITDASGEVVTKYTYSAWGIRSLKSGTDFGYRGYTGHEHLDEFGLINMNARLYDPVLGRFLGMDPYVQMPDFTQNYNRYSYALNNPFSYIDPDGENPLAILAILAIAGAMNTITHIPDIQASNHWGWATLSYFGIGAAGAGIALVAGPIGPFASGAFVSGMSDIASQGFAKGGENINWGQVGMSSLTGGIMSWAGSALSAELTPFINKIIPDFAGPMVQQGLTDAVVSSATSVTLNTAFAMGFNDASDPDYWRNVGTTAWQSAAFGFTTGAMNGMAKGYYEAKSQNVGPWSGKDLSLSPKAAAKTFGIEKTLKRIENGEAHPHKNDGAIHQNREGLLPSKDPGYYKEYVHPTEGVKGAGLQRIVTGSGGEIYYTPDHYKTFIKIK